MRISPRAEAEDRGPEESHDGPHDDSAGMSGPGVSAPGARTNKRTTKGQRVRITELASELDQISQETESPIRIGILGGFSSGKTRLMECLIGAGGRLPVSVNPSTGNITILAFPFRTGLAGNPIPGLRGRVCHARGCPRISELSETEGRIADHRSGTAAAARTAPVRRPGRLGEGQDLGIRRRVRRKRRSMSSSISATSCIASRRPIRPAALCSKGSGSLWTRKPRWRRWLRRAKLPHTGLSRSSSSLRACGI